MSDSSTYRTALFKLAAHYDCAVTQTGSGHYKLRLPGIKGSVTASGSPHNAHMDLILAEQRLERMLRHAKLASLPPQKSMGRKPHRPFWGKPKTTNLMRNERKALWVYKNSTVRPNHTPHV
jgi:hypothetical protein